MNRKSTAEGSELAGDISMDKHSYELDAMNLPFNHRYTSQGESPCEVRAIAKNINVSINTTHWKIGMLLHEKKLESKHGSGVVNRLSVDLKQKYPEMGVSPRNLWDMKKFYERFKESDEKLRHAVAVLPWWNTLKLMSKLGDNDEAILYYAQETVRKGWNRWVLENLTYSRILSRSA